MYDEAEIIFSSFNYLALFQPGTFLEEAQIAWTCKWFKQGSVEVGWTNLQISLALSSVVVCFTKEKGE